MAKKYLLARAKIEEHARLRDGELACAKVLGVYETTAGPASAEHMAAHPTAGRTLPVRLRSRKAWYRDVKGVQYRDLARYLRRHILREGRDIWLRLDADPYGFGLHLDGVHAHGATEDIRPGVSVNGFRWLASLLHHLLKHVLGYQLVPEDRGARRRHWQEFLRAEMTPDQAEQALRDNGCPAVSRARKRPLRDEHGWACNGCSAPKRLSCYGRIFPLVERYLENAVREVASVSEPNTWRHLHYVRKGVGHDALVSGDGTTGSHMMEVVLKGDRNRKRPYWFATAFLHETSANRRKQRALRRRNNHRNNGGDRTKEHVRENWKKW